MQISYAVVAIDGGTRMNVNWILGIPFGMSVLLLLVAVTGCVCLHRAELRPNEPSLFRRILTAFRLFLIIFFFTAVCAVYPLSHFGFVNRGSDIVKAILSSIINSFRLFFMAGDYLAASTIIKDCTGLYSWLSMTYLIYLACVYLVAPLFTIGFVLSFFRDASSTIRYALSRRSDLYLFSELNERSLALAKDIVEKNCGKRKILLVFTDVFPRSEERTEELIASAKRLKALCMKKDITEVGLSLKKNCAQKIYLISENEDENIQQALTLINHHAGGKFDTEKLEFYVFSNTVESEALLTSVYSNAKENEKKCIPQAMKIRRVNENRNFALQEMLNHPIFDGAEDKEGVKQIGIVIIGLGGYGTELLKTICWCSQMPGYALTLHVFEKKKENGEEKIKSIAPELIAYNHNKKPFEAQYDIEFYDDDVECAEFIDKLTSLDGITKVYVSLGDDEKNIEIAMRIRAALGREAQKRKGKIPPIYSIVYSASKTETVRPNDELKYMDKGTGIFLIGGLNSRYTIDGVEQTDLEKDALALHQIYQAGEAGLISFNQYEYNRSSSMARAVYQKLRNKKCAIKRMDGDSEEAKRNNDILRDFEHRRWNTYMRSEGYVHAPIKGSDKISKLHHDLIAFDELSEAEKEKDDF